MPQVSNLTKKPWSLNMKATGHLLPEYLSDKKVNLALHKINKYKHQNQRYPEKSWHFSQSYRNDTRGNNNWSRSKMDNLFIAAKIKHETRSHVSIFRFVLITTTMISTPGPQCSLLWPGGVVSIPALNIYFVRIFLGICAWTNHYHKHNIIRIRTRLCILKWVKG